MRLAVTSAEELGTISGSTLTLAGNVDGAATFAGALLRSAQVIDSTESSADGYETTVRVEYADQVLNGYDYEVWHVTYNTSGDTLTLDTRLDSNDGGSAVTWSGDVRVYGIASSTHLIPEKVICLQDPDTIDFTNPVSGVTSTSYQSGADTAKITPVSDQSVLQVTVVISGFAGRTSSGSNFDGTVRVHYINDSGTSTVISNDKKVGLSNMPADANMGEDWGQVFQFTMTQDELNDETPAKWEIEPVIKTNGTDRTITCTNATMQVREILRLS